MKQERQNTFSKDLDRIKFAMNAAGIGVWELDTNTNTVVWDDRCRALFGLAKENVIPYEDAVQFIHPDDKPAVDAAVQAALSGANGGAYDATYRTLGADDGQLRWVHFSGTAYFDENGQVTRFGGVARDVTDSQQVQDQIEQSQQQLISLFDQSPVALATIAREGLTFTSANRFYGELVGRDPIDLIGKTLFDALPEIREQGFDALLQGVLDTGVPFTAPEVGVDLLRNGTLERVYVNLAYQPVRDRQGIINTVFVVATDVTAQVVARKVIEESQAKLLGVIAAAPAAIGLFIGRDLVIQHPNQTFIDIVGKGPGVDGLPLREAMPELAAEGQPFLKILDDVYTTGVPFISPASLVKIVQNGVLNDNYYNISYTPLRNAQGEIYGILDIAIDVTELVTTQQQLALKTQELENSEARFRQLIEEAPVATCLFVGRELRVEIANPTMLDVWGKGHNVVGLTLVDVLPELVGQPFLDILDNIFLTGEAFSGTGMPVELVKDGTLGTYYFDFTYKPLRDESGNVYAIMDMAVDVTETVRARQAIERSEKKLTEAIDLAELGTWSFDLATRSMTYSPRMQGWYGFDKTEVPADEILQQVLETDRERVRETLYRDYKGQEVSRMDDEHPVVNRHTGRQYILHSVGKPVFNAQGDLIRVEGTTRDVTATRSQQLTLEQEVEKRTEELQATVEELAESNEALYRSNEELAQYAYVASHDLQEPLRKIRVFAGMLDADQSMPVKSKDLLQKITSSSARMATLIGDLLEFSRLLKADTLFGPTDLNTVLNEVVTDFELVANEKSAQIQVSDLPTVEAMSLQMNQLFYNLIGNALKFTRPGTIPEVDVTAEQLPTAEVIQYIRKPLPAATYYRICVKDNGIGFEAAYQNQIFEVFKRLHGREVYPGSGIGLALCRRIVANHNGYLYTESTPGKGATFCLILPDKQA